MSHDFAKKKSGKPQKTKRKSNQKNTPSKNVSQKTVPNWIWFIAGIIVTLFSQFLYQLTQVDTDDLLPEDRTVNQRKSTDSEKDKHKENTQKKTRKPKIEFYTTLKEREVKVPNDVVKEREKETYSYALQAGAFKKLDDAEQQRVEIILLGLDAQIESRKNKSNTLYHRIIVGPFSSRSALASARNKLIGNNIPSMKIKR